MSTSVQCVLCFDYFVPLSSARVYNHDWCHKCFKIQSHNENQRRFCEKKCAPSGYGRHVDGCYLKPKCWDCGSATTRHSIRCKTVIWCKIGCGGYVDVTSPSLSYTCKESCYNYAKTLSGKIL